MPALSPDNMMFVAEIIPTLMIVSGLYLFGWVAWKNLRDSNDSG